MGQKLIYPSNVLLRTESIQCLLYRKKNKFFIFGTKNYTYSLHTISQERLREIINKSVAPSLLSLNGVPIPSRSSSNSSWLAYRRVPKTRPLISAISALATPQFQPQRYQQFSGTSQDLRQHCSYCLELKDTKPKKKTRKKSQKNHLS